jgi:hypothetical protein
MVVQDSPQARLVEHHEIAVGRSPDGDCARRVDQERDLAEEIAVPERLDHAPAVVEHLGLTAHDDVHLVSDVALADDRLPRVRDLRPQGEDHLSEEERVAVLEDRHPLEHVVGQHLEPATGVALDEVRGRRRAPAAPGVVRKVCRRGLQRLEHPVAEAEGQEVLHGLLAEEWKRPTSWSQAAASKAWRVWNLRMSSPRRVRNDSVVSGSTAAPSTANRSSSKPSQSRL